MKQIRKYQSEAVKVFMDKKQGIINIPTGSGKTLIAAEIIRQADTKTLWIIDRKELLQQTKKVLHELLEIPIGEISGDLFDIQDITIATVQSLNSRLFELLEYLYTISFVCIDEYHKSAAETYQKVFAKLPNTKYRLGLTATAQRSDGKTPILFSVLGEIIVKITTEELVKLGYLVKPEIRFYNLSGCDYFSTTYIEDYANNIVHNIERNKLIVKLVDKYKDKKILILTKSIPHGKILNKEIPGSAHIHGKARNREQNMQDFRDNKIRCMVMTVSIGAEGLDIPDLDIIINAGANKNDVKSIQVLGRVLRIFKNKDSALYIDFLDIGRHTRKHSEARIAAFKSEGHEVRVVE